MPRQFESGARRLAGLLFVALAALFALTAHSDETVDAIRKRGELRCGVADGIPGLAREEADGRWHGMEPDFCRAVAAAVLGESGRVRFVPLPAPTRFPALLTGRVDLLLANTTWTLAREVAFGVRFPAVLLHDGQSFMVPAASPAQDPDDLREAVICVEKDTTHSARLQDLATHLRLAVKPLLARSATAAADTFFAGQCAALSGEAAQLAALRYRAGKTAAEYRILPRAISREPTGPVVRGGDAQWETVVRWVLYTLLLAEELHVNQADAADPQYPAFTAAWGATNDEETRLISASLGLDGPALLRGVRAAGNYGEIFERNLGSASPIGLPRAANRLWQDGGLMYVPPLK